MSRICNSSSGGLRREDAYKFEASFGVMSCDSQDTQQEYASKTVTKGQGRNSKREGGREGATAYYLIK